MAEGGPTLARNVLPPNIEAGDEFALRSNSATSGDLDFIAAYEAWRKQCPDYKKLWHGSFCERCDMLVWQMPTGGVTFQKSESGSYFAPQTEDKSLAGVDGAAKINKHSQNSARREFEEPHMSDYIRDILRMSGGGNLSGRGNFSVPSELMNALAGDEAQEALAKERLLNEMKKQDVAKHDPRYVTIQLMEMEKNDVDGFLAHARKRIIKRGKEGRKGCCARIGGVLDIVLGPEGGEDTLKDVKPEDRGKDDPIGKAESIENALEKFIGEEFGLREHSADCALRASLEKNLSEQDKFVQGAVKRPSALRQHYGLREGEQIPVDKAQAEFDALQQKVHDDVTLSEDEAKLLRRLQFFLTVVKPALAEAAAGDLTLKTRPDNSAYQTAPAKLSAGKSKTAGAPTKAKVRSVSKALGESSSNAQAKHDADRRAGVLARESREKSKAALARTASGDKPWRSAKPVGEECLNALVAFTEATAGDLTLKKRADNSAYPTELTAVNGGNKSKIAGKPTPAKVSDRGKADPLGKAEQDASVGTVAEQGDILSTGERQRWTAAYRRRRMGSHVDTPMDNLAGQALRGRSDDGIRSRWERADEVNDKRAAKRFAQKAQESTDDEQIAEAGPIAAGALRKVGMGLGRQSLVGRGLMGGKSGMAMAAKRIAAMPKSKQLQMGAQALGALGIQAQSADSHLDDALSAFMEAHKEGSSAASPSKKPYTAGPSTRSDNTDAGIKTGLSKGPSKRGVKPNDPIGGKK